MLDHLLTPRSILKTEKTLSRELKNSQKKSKEKCSIRSSSRTSRGRTEKLRRKDRRKPLKKKTSKLTRRILLNLKDPDLLGVTMERTEMDTLNSMRMELPTHHGVSQPGRR